MDCIEEVVHSFRGGISYFEVTLTQRLWSGEHRTHKKNCNKSRICPLSSRKNQFHVLKWITGLVLYIKFALKLHCAILFLSLQHTPPLPCKKTCTPSWWFGRADDVRALNSTPETPSSQHYRRETTFQLLLMRTAQGFKCILWKSMRICLAIKTTTEETRQRESVLNNFAHLKPLIWS